MELEKALEKFCPWNEQEAREASILLRCTMQSRRNGRLFCACSAPRTASVSRSCVKSVSQKTTYLRGRDIINPLNFEL